MTSEQTQALDDLGFVVLPGFLTPAEIQTLRDEVERLFAAEGDQAGLEFKQEPGARRLANLIDKGEVFRDLIVRPEILDLVGHVLGPEFKLSSLNVRSANPYSDSPQPLHADMGAVADERGYWVCNTVWMLDDFTAENGALRAVPRTHLLRKLPGDVLTDLHAPHPDEVLVTGKAGTVVVMNAHLWHGGTGNRTGAHRRAIHGFFARGDKPQQQYQKRLVRPEIQQQSSPSLRKLLALDDPLNDEICSRPYQTSGFLK